MLNPPGLSGEPIKIGWYEQKESVGTYLLPVPRFEAFALPSVVERATSKPTPIWIYYSPTNAVATLYMDTIRRTNHGGYE